MEMRINRLFPTASDLISLNTNCINAKNMFTYFIKFPTTYNKIRLVEFKEHIVICLCI